MGCLPKTHDEWMRDFPRLFQPLPVEPDALDAGDAPLNRRERRHLAKLERRERKRARRRGPAAPVSARSGEVGSAGRFEACPEPEQTERFARPPVETLAALAPRDEQWETPPTAEEPPAASAPRRRPRPTAAIRVAEGERLMRELFHDDPAEALKRRRRTNNPLWERACDPEDRKNYRTLRDSLRIACRNREAGLDAPLAKLSATAALVLCRRALSARDVRMLAFRAVDEAWTAARLREESYRLAPKQGKPA